VCTHSGCAIKSCGLITSTHNFLQSKKNHMFFVQCIQGDFLVGFVLGSCLTPCVSALRLLLKSRHCYPQMHPKFNMGMRQFFGIEEENHDQRNTTPHPQRARCKGFIGSTHRRNAMNPRLNIAYKIYAPEGTLSASRMRIVDIRRWKPPANLFFIKIG